MEKIQYKIQCLLLLVVLSMCSTSAVFAGWLTDPSQLTIGCVIKIYPLGGSSEQALSCAGKGQPLTTYNKAKTGDTWFITNAGDNHVYIVNGETYVSWGFHGEKSMTCDYSRVPVRISWDSDKERVTFSNAVDGQKLLFSRNYSYFKWGGNAGDDEQYFGIEIVKQDGNYGPAIYDTKKSDYHLPVSLLLYLNSKTARQINDLLTVRGIIPSVVTDDGVDYTVTSMDGFYNCKYLREAEIPNTIKSLPERCFWNCDALSSVRLPNSITSLPKQCFSLCKGLREIELPQSITSLGEGCFDATGLYKINLPDAITSLPKECFAYCYSGFGYGLEYITLPKGLTSIGESCFRNCQALPSITLPESVTSIGKKCFYACASFTNFTLPEGITSLPDSCFTYCVSLKKMSLPSTLETIGKDVLKGIDNDIVISCFAQTPPKNVSEDFITSKCRLFVPKESLEKYRTTLPWSNAYSINPLYPVESITMPSEVSVVRTKTTKLEYTVLPENAVNKKVKWSSENPDIASVDADGVITGKQVGSTKIIATATDDSETSSYTTVTVTPLQIESMTFAEPKVSVTKTESATVAVTINPIEADNKSMTWTSSDESIATVAQSADEAKPLEAVVTAKKVGKAVIKAEAQDGSGVSATCEVEVTPLMVSDISAQTTSIVKTIPTEMEMSITPAEADNQKLKWSSLTPEIATVTEEGMVTGQQMGTATLKAETTDGSNISKTFEVQVIGLPVSTISMPEEASIIKTEKQKLEYSILPLASDNQTLKWSSDAPTVASVDETSGVITANKVGDAVITATATDGSGISASTTIHVTPLKVSHINISETLSLLRTMTGQVETTIEPELADDKTLEWTSDDENIATVSKEGVVKGINVGTANITATTTDGSNLSATCKVTVAPVTIDLSTKTINLCKGENYTEQMVDVLPTNYEHKDVSWSSSDNGVASVNADGVITAVKPGVTTIKYVLDYDNNISSECKVLVYDDNVAYVGGIYYILDKEKKEASVTSIYGGKNTSLDANNVAQYYSGTINIPETIIYDGSIYTVKYVGSYAFNCQNDLQSIIVPRTVTTIQDKAAIMAENLNRVNVANDSQLENIGKQAFMDCTGLKRFTFDGTSLSMNIIGSEAFKNCTALERVTWTDETSLKSIGNGAFFKCTSLNNFYMPNTTLSVGNSAFRYNSSLTNIRFSASLNYIDEYAFGECGFSQITLPESLANIQAGAFINNKHLQEITLPERLQGLGSAAFENNSALESVTFKTAIETMTIGSNAFNQCPILNKVYITNLKSFAQTNFNNAKANPANTSQHIYDADGNEIINVVLPKGTKYVNNNVFNGCAYIESIEMPETMDHINDDIFYGCSALKDVYCYAENVPDFIGVNDPSTMNDVFNLATLHVAYGNENAYKADSWWGRFYNIEGCYAPGTEDVKVSSITISQTAATLKPDEAIQLTATVSPTNATNQKIIWKSSTEDVAQVTEDGLVLAIAEGETDITAEAADGSGVTATCKITVKKPEVKLTEISFVNTAMTIEEGASVALDVNFYPENATNKQLVWSSSCPAVATVDANGVVTALSEGETVITAKSMDGSNLTITCVVTISKATGIGNITMGNVKIIIDKRHLKLEGLADNDIVQIVNTIGFTVYKGTEHEIDLSASGIYIIKVNGKMLKFSVK